MTLLIARRIGIGLSPLSNTRTLKIIITELTGG